MADDEGQRIKRKAGVAVVRAHDGVLLVSGAPGQLKGPSRTILSIIRATLAPFADGLGGDAVGLGEWARTLARTAGVVRAWGWMASISGPSWLHDGAQLRLGQPGRITGAPRTFDGSHGRRVGLTGVIWCLCSADFADHLYVNLDIIGAECSETAVFVELRDVNLIEAGSAV